MKVLYVAYRHDPRDPDLASGADYNFFKVLQRNRFNVRLLGPFTRPPVLLERLLKKLYKKLHPERKYVKYDLTNTWRASQALNQVDKEWKPDLIFTLYPPPLAFYTGHTPCVFRTDTTFLGMHDQGAEFLQHGKLALKICVWEEHRAFRKCAKVITHSDWSKDVMINDYGLGPELIEVIANPSALPSHAVPDDVGIMSKNQLEKPLRLLLVGRDYQRKGVDIAVKVVNWLNDAGIPAELTVCGASGEEFPNVKLVGPYKKSDPKQLRQYTELYKRSHFLLHPTRFDASPIVASEAAAFGVPTITNNVGGMATSVKDGESGIVLLRGSPPETYARAIMDLVSNPEAYYELCRKTRQRYERELNWEVTGKRVVSILREVAEEKQLGLPVRRR